MALALWYLAGTKRSRNIKLTTDALEKFHISRNRASDGLRRLEAAGLVSVSRKRGRLPIVTVHDAT